MISIGLNRNILITNLNDRVNLLLNTMVKNVLRIVNQNNANFNETVDNFKKNSITFISNNTIAENLLTLFNDYDLVTDNPKDRYSLALGLFKFGEDETLNKTNPNLNISIEAFDTYARLLALVKGYNASSNIAFVNQEELDEIIKQLESEYKFVTSSNIDRDTKTSLLELKTNTIAFFTQLRLRSIVEIDIKRTPSTVLSYFVNEDSTQSDDIVNLNNAYNTGFIKGRVKVLSER